MKYPINKEFSPYSRMTPPVQNAKMAGWMGSKMKPPRWVQKNRDCEVSIKKENIKSYDGAELSVVVIDPYRNWDTGSNSQKEVLFQTVISLSCILKSLI